jgi:hypothetical protein
MTREMELLQRQNDLLQLELEEGKTRHSEALHSQVPPYLCSRKYVVIYLYMCAFMHAGRHRAGGA